MTERWKIVILIIVVVMALIFAFFAGLAIGQKESHQTNDRSSYKTISNSALQSEENEKSEKDPDRERTGDGTLLNQKEEDASPKAIDQKPGSELTSAPASSQDNAILDDAEKTNKEKTFAPDSIGHILTTSRSRRNIILGGSDKLTNESTARTPSLVFATAPVYTLSTIEPIRLMVAKPYIHRLTSLGHKVDTLPISSSGNQNLIIMRIGKYSTRMEAENAVRGLPLTNRARFTVLRVAAAPTQKDKIEPSQNGG